MKAGIYSEHAALGGRQMRFLVLVFVLAAGRLSANTLVVSQHDPRARDSNKGSASAPLATITAAAQRVKPGDRVVVHAGDYRETVVITTSGTADAPIVFEAALGERPVIKGSDVLHGWEKDGSDVWKTKLPPMPANRRADGRDPAFWRTNDVRQVFTRDGVFLEAERLTRVMTRETMRAGSFFCDKASATLYVWLADSASPNEHPPEVALRGEWLYVDAAHVVVRGFAMRQASTMALAPWPACSINGENNTLENCVITWGDFTGVSVSGRGQHLRRNVVACHGGCGLGGKGENHLIEECRFIYNNVDRFDPSWHAGGAKLIPGFSNSVIRHNEFAHNLGCGLWLDSQCDRNVIAANFSHDNEGAGIMIEVSRGNLVVNNVSSANQNFRSGPFRDSTGEAHDIAWSEQRIAPARMRIYHAGDGRGIYVSSAPETKVLHNTVTSNEAEGICVEGPPRDVEGVTMATGGSVVMNNIIVFNHGSQLTVTLADKADQSGTVSDHNILFATGALLAKKGWSGPGVLSLPEWQTATGQDAHSFDADPRFAMEAMDDFRLLTGSAGLSQAAPSDDVKDDFRGQKRDAEKPTIGAFETAADGETFSLLDPDSWPRGSETR